MTNNKQENQRVTRPFLKQTKGWKKEETQVEEIKEFALLLMKNNGHTDFLENVKAGEFFMKSEDGKEEKSIQLTPNKLTTLNYNGQYFKGWIAHEDNMSPYPQDPVHNAEIYRKTTQKLAMNYRDANEANIINANTKKILMIMGALALIMYIIYIIVKNTDAPQAIQTAQTVQTIATQTIKNNTGVIVS